MERRGVTVTAGTLQRRAHRLLAMRRARAGRDRRWPSHALRSPDSKALAALLSALMVVSWNRLTIDSWLGRVDVVTFYLPWYSYLGERLSSGSIPGWNPYQFSGTPFAADPQSGWMYLPAMLPFALLSPVAAFKTMVVAQLTIAAVSTYGFARLQRLDPIPALAASMVFSFGPFLIHDTACCTVRAQLATWIPAALLGCDLLVRGRSVTRRVLGLLLCAVALSQQYAGWLGQGALDGTLLLLAWLAYRTLGQRDIGFSRRVALLAGFATAVMTSSFALAAAGLLPRVVTNRETNLADADYSAVGGYSGQPFPIVEVLGHVLGDGAAHRAVAVGGVAALCSVMAPILSPRHHTVRFFAPMTVVVFLLSTNQTRLNDVFYLIPRFKVLHEHYPTQVLAVVMIGPAMLTGATLQALSDGVSRRRSNTAVVIAASGIAAAAAWVKLAGGALDPLPLGSAVLLAVAVLVSSHPSLCARDNPRQLPMVVGITAATLIFTQPTGLEILQSASGHIFESDWRPHWQPTPEEQAGFRVATSPTGTGGSDSFLRSVEDPIGDFRYLGYGGVGYPGTRQPSYMVGRNDPIVLGLLVNGRSIFLGLDDVQGYNPVQLQRYVELMAAINGGAQDYHVANLRAGGADSPLLSLLGVRYIIVSNGLPRDRADVVEIALRGPIVYSDNKVTIYRNDSALPRVWLVDRVIPVQAGDAIPRMLEPGYTPSEEAIIDGVPPENWHDTQCCPGGLSYSSPDPETLHVETWSDHQTFLTINVPNVTGWVASIDGRPAKIYPTNHALMGVFVPSGNRQVTITYRPRSLEVGVLITTSAYILSAVLVLVLSLRRPGGVRRRFARGGKGNLPSQSEHTELVQSMIHRSLHQLSAPRRP